MPILGASSSLNWRRWAGVFAIGAVVILVVQGLHSKKDKADSATGAASTALTRLHTTGSPAAGYVRTKFGPPWADVDHNRCDTRNDVLAAQLTHIKRSGRCIVLSGTLKDPYTGQTIRFVRGVRTSDLVQIDHVVALGNAWATGAAHWSATRREQYANDPLNLLAVDGHNNESKGDYSAAQWLPPAKSFDCQYVARQIAVKTKYQLAVTSAERAAMTRTLHTCPGQELPHD